MISDADGKTMVTDLSGQTGDCPSEALVMHHDSLGQEANAPDGPSYRTAHVPNRSSHLSGPKW